MRIRMLMLCALGVSCWSAACSSNKNPPALLGGQQMAGVTAAAVAGTTAPAAAGSPAAQGGSGAPAPSAGQAGNSATSGTAAPSAGSSAAAMGAAGSGAGSSATASGAGAPAAAGSGAGGSATAGAAGAPAAAGSGGGTGGAGGSSGAAGAGGGSSMQPIPAPAADDCITNVSPGDHSFTCKGLRFMLMVAEQCTKVACGVIVDVHGAAMSGEIMRTNNRLHILAPPMGYLTIHPTSAASGWDLVAEPPLLYDVMMKTINAFHADKKRVHMTGFSMGSAMTHWFLCNHPELLASAAPVTGASADQTRVESTGANCVEALNADWKPRVPILFMSGSMDGALTISAARARTDGIVMRLGLTGGMQVDGDATFTRKRWTGAEGMVFDFLEHNYSNAILQGHCIPGGSPSDALFACTSGGNSLKWGETVLKWFVEHPKP